jgi:guanyl-specific ribonuclease Sa
LLPKQNSVPQSAFKVVGYANKKNGAAQNGYVGGRIFNNDPRGGGQELPRIDAQGNSIIYREYDTNKHVKGQDRGAERVIIGSNGTAYYTRDH